MLKLRIITYCLNSRIKILGLVKRNNKFKSRMVKLRYVQIWAVANRAQATVRFYTPPLCISKANWNPKTQMEDATNTKFKNSSIRIICPRKKNFYTSSLPVSRAIKRSITKINKIIWKLIWMLWHLRRLALVVYKAKISNLRHVITLVDIYRPWKIFQRRNIAPQERSRNSK